MHASIHFTFSSLSSLSKNVKAFAVFFEIQEVCTLQFLEMVRLSAPGHPQSGIPLFWCVHNDILGSRFYCTVNRIVLVLCGPTLKKLVCNHSEIVVSHGIPVHCHNKTVSGLTSTLTEKKIISFFPERAHSSM